MTGNAIDQLIRGFGDNLNYFQNTIGFINVDLKKQQHFLFKLPFVDKQYLIAIFWKQFNFDSSHKARKNWFNIIFILTLAAR